MSASSLQKTLRTILQIGTALVLFVPLVYVGNTFFPFVFGKVVIFRILIELLLPVWVALMVISKPSRPRFGLLLWLLAAHMAAMVLATIFGFDPARSFWSNHERMLGTFTYLHGFLYTLMLISAWGREHWNRLLLVALVVSGFEVGAYLLQITKPGFLLGDASLRQWGTLGNYLYLAEFLLVHLLITLYLALRATSRNLRILGFAWVGVLVVVLLLNTSRSTFIGMMAAFIIFSFIFSIWGRSARSRMAGMAATGLLIASFLLIVMVSGSPITKKNFLLSRLSNISSVSGTGATRLIAWRIAWQGFTERPIFGWGPENFYYAFNYHYNPVSLEHSYYETWFDRPHNFFLEILSTEGLVGFITFISFPIGAAYLLLRRARQDPGVLFSHATLVVLLGAPLIIKALVFENAASLIDGALVAAWVMVALEHKTKDASATPGSTTAAALWGAGIGIIAVVLAFTTNIQPWVANARALYAARVTKADPAAGLALYDRALEVNDPYHADIQLSLGRDYLEAASGSNLSKDLIISGGQKVAREMEDLIAKHPADVFKYLILGQVYTIMGTVDPQYLDLGEATYAKGIQYSPERQQYLYSWGRLRLLKKDFVGARALFLKTRDLDPRIGDSYWLLALTAGETGDKDETRRLMKYALTYRYEFKSRNEGLVAIRVMKEANDMPGLAMAIQRAAEVFSGDGVFRFFFAESLGAAGDIEGAEREARAALDLEPRLRPDVDQLLQKLHTAPQP